MTANLISDRMGYSVLAAHNERSRHGSSVTLRRDNPSKYSNLSPAPWSPTINPLCYGGGGGCLTGREDAIARERTTCGCVPSQLPSKVPDHHSS